MIEMRYKLAALLKALATDPANLLCLIVFAVAGTFVIAVVVDAVIQRRKFNRLKKPYQRGRV
jgi:hypothetical protein